MTKWFTDYIYIPIVKKRKKSYLIKSLALFVSMGLIGFWHGANWTFIVFGIYQAVTISIERIPFKINGKKVSLNYYLTRMPIVFAISYSFIIITTSCIFFRAETLESSLYIIKKIISIVPSERFSLIIGIKVLVIPILIFIEYITRYKNHPLEGFEKSFNKPLRWAVYYLFIFIIIRYSGPVEQFIYFQF